MSATATLATWRSLNRPNGVVLYDGPSEIDGARIIMILTGLASGSANAKTGSMLQTWILRADRAPHHATKDGTDASICGDCIHRGDGRKRSCYVLVHNAPRSVWAAWGRGRYPVADASMRAGIASGLFGSVRLGAYGDPAAVPVSAWSGLVDHKRTGYTHQWRTAPALRPYVMASVDSEAEAIEARAAGWRTFRVAAAGDVARMTGEVVCPASDEGGKRTSCDACGLCSGNRWEGRSRVPASVVIQAHGSASANFTSNRSSRLTVLA